MIEEKIENIYDRRIARNAVADVHLAIDLIAELHKKLREMHPIAYNFGMFILENKKEWL